MVNKSMMHTHASGCHKRRSLPAHSLAAAGLSLLLALSCPLSVRADANFLKENIFNSTLPDLGVRRLHNWYR